NCISSEWRTAIPGKTTGRDHIRRRLQRWLSLRLSAAEAQRDSGCFLYRHRSCWDRPASVLRPFLFLAEVSPSTGTAAVAHNRTRASREGNRQSIAESSVREGRATVCCHDSISEHLSSTGTRRCCLGAGKPHLNRAGCTRRICAFELGHGRNALPRRHDHWFAYEISHSVDDRER